MKDKAFGHLYRLVQFNSIIPPQSEDEDSEVMAFSKKKLVMRVILGGLVTLSGLAITLLIRKQLHFHQTSDGFMANDSALSVGCGVLFCFLIHCVPFFRKILLKPYIWGHEATHALFVFLFYGKVSEFKTSVDGGYIVANRDNIFIALAPYIFPFWVLMLAALFVLLGCIVNLTSALLYFYVLFGIAWSFNLIWTFLMIPLGQSDLKNNGTLFSLTLIYTSNALILSAILEWVSPKTDFELWAFEVINAHMDIFRVFTMLY